jgi:hypothetical protein
MMYFEKKTFSIKIIYKRVLRWLLILYFVLCDVFIHMFYVLNVYLCAIYQYNIEFDNESVIVLSSLDICLYSRNSKDLSRQ